MTPPLDRHLPLDAFAGVARAWATPGPADAPGSDNDRLRPLLEGVARYVLDLAAAGRIRPMPGGPFQGIRFLGDWHAVAAGRGTPRQAHVVAWYLCKGPLRTALTAARAALDGNDAVSSRAVHGAFLRKVSAGDFHARDTYPVIRPGHREPLRVEVAGWTPSAFTVVDGHRVRFAAP